MLRDRKLAAAAAVGCSVLGICALATGAPASPVDSAASGVGAFDSGSNRITNPYLPITNFHRTVLAGVDGRQHLRIVRTLQQRTKTFRYHGTKVKAAVVKDVVTDTRRHFVIERTLDYFAQDVAGNVYYFGEDVNEYEPHKPVSHEGQWRYGRDTDVPGVLMPAQPTLGSSFRSEAVPGVTHETDHVVAAGATQRVAGQLYHDVITVRENAGPPKEIELKTYAPGVGVITEANDGINLIASR